MNAVSLIGRIGTDITLKTTQNGNRVCSFNLAVRKSADQTIWLRVVAWRGTAELAATHLTKGDLVGITGSIDSRTYEKDGEKRTAFEIIANSLHFIGGKKNNNDEPASENGDDTFQNVDDFEDDLPF